MTDRSRTRLADGDVHVWWVRLTVAGWHARQLASLLSPEEAERAGRMRVAVDRQRFIVGRAALRVLVGHYLGLSAQQVRFEQGRYGKPRIAAGMNPEGLEFNYSRSEELALYALARGRAVGIDVERILPLPDAAQVAHTLFSSRERAALFALPEVEQLAAFYRCWTRKEAYLKATGTGLSGDPGRFTVSLAPGEPARLLHVEGNAVEASRWSFQSLELAAGYAAAVAVEGQGWHLVSRQWNWDSVS